MLYKSQNLIDTFILFLLIIDTYLSIDTYQCDDTVNFNTADVAGTLVRMMHSVLFANTVHAGIDQTCEILSAQRISLFLEGQQLESPNIIGCRRERKIDVYKMCKFLCQKLWRLYVLVRHQQIHRVSTARCTCTCQFKGDARLEF